MLGTHAPPPLAAWLGFATLALTIGCENETVCIERQSKAATCPSREQAERLIQCGGGSDVLSIDSEAEIDDGACCYDSTKSNERYPVAYESCDAPPTGTDTQCVGCAPAVSTGDPTGLCESSAVLYDALARCLCIESCAVECADNSCSGVPADNTCLNCADTFCAVELDSCATDF